MTREEFILQRLRDDCAMYRMLFIVCAIATAGAVVLAIAVVVSGGVSEAFAALALGATIGGYAYASRATWKSLGQALAEVEEDPEGLAFPEDYSVATATAIEKVQLPAKSYRGQVIAYGVTAAMMLVGGAFLLALLFGSGMDFYDAEPVFAILGSLLFGGGVLVGILCGQAARNARAAKQFESADSDE